MNQITEQCFLGCIIKSPELWDKIKFTIKRDNFIFAPSLKLYDIFQKWVTENENYKESDTNDFLLYIESEYNVWAKGHKEFLKEIFTFIVDKEQATEKIDYYSNLLQIGFLNKKTQDILSSLHNKIQGSPLQTASILHEGISDLNLLNNYLNSSNKEYNLQETVNTKTDDFVKKLADDYFPTVTSLSSVNQILGGIDPGTLNLLAARSSMGKSAFMKDWCLDMLNNQNKKVAVFNLETNNNAFIDRCASTELKIDFQLIKNPKNLSKPQREILMNYYLSFKEKYDNKLFLYDNVYYQDKIFEKILSVYNTHGLDAVFIDLVSYVRRRDTFPSRQLELAAISADFLKFAKDYPKLFICLVQQMNKSGDNATPDSNSGQTSLREAEDTYLQSDTVIFIYPVKNEEKIKDKESRIITIDKNRNGDTGSTQVRFIKEYLLFSEQTLGETLAE